MEAGWAPEPAVEAVGISAAAREELTAEAAEAGRAAVEAAAVRVGLLLVPLLHRSIRAIRVPAAQEA